MSPVLMGFLWGIAVGLIVYMVSSLTPFTIAWAPVLALVAFLLTWYTVYTRRYR